MVLTVGLALGAVIVIAIFTFSPSDPRIVAVEYQPTAVEARRNGAFPVATPATPPTGWQATSVRYRPYPDNPKLATWHLGFYVPGDNYVAVQQTNADDPTFLKESTVSGTRQGSQQVTGKTWTQYYSPSSGHYSLVNETDGVTTVVTGTLDYAGLASFAATLTDGSAG